MSKLNKEYEVMHYASGASFLHRSFVCGVLFRVYLNFSHSGEFDERLFVTSFDQIGTPSQMKRSTSRQYYAYGKPASSVSGEGVLVVIRSA